MTRFDRQVLMFLSAGTFSLGLMALLAPGAGIGYLFLWSLGCNLVFGLLCRLPSGQTSPAVSGSAVSVPIDMLPSVPRYMRMGLAMSLVAAAIALALVAVLAPTTPPGWLFVLCLLLSAFLIA